MIVGAGGEFRLALNVCQDPEASGLIPAVPAYDLNPVIKEGTVKKLTLTLAIGNYDHVRDVIDGQVPVQGARLIVLNLPPEEVFFRFTIHREWDVSEMSMGSYVSMRSQDDDSVTALPVFVSRVFRH